MPCSKEEALVRLFYNVSSSFHLLFLFLYCSTLLLLKLFHFLRSNPLIQRNENGYEYHLLSEEEEVDQEEEEERYVHHAECTEKDDPLVADIIHGGEAPVLSLRSQSQRFKTLSEEFITPSETLSVHESSRGSESEDEVEDVFVEELLPTRDIKDADSVILKSDPNQSRPTTSMPISINLRKSELDQDKDKNPDHEDRHFRSERKDQEFLIFEPPNKLETKKFLVQEKDDDDHDEIFGDSCTVGSTSKSSSEWRSSINCRDSGTEDPFSSSSRRSCPKWESYTVFQKYDEEMTFLDRISAQKLQETESLRSIQVCPRSISERLVHKFATMNKRPPPASDIRQNPYQELEAAYVAQICLTWEALNWNYKYFQQKRASRQDHDPGCPAHVAQEFQQFQVLLQRYVENEPYEQGRRPEVYARMRLLAPKLLLVPEYRDSEDDQKQDGFGSRISSAEFLLIMEDGIRTFMNFLKADKQKPCQIISAFFRRNRKGSIDPTLLNLVKKVNQKKKTKLKDLRGAWKCLRKRSRLKVDEEMEILMGLIDLKVVSRVLRMKEINEEQMHWCEEKMSKVRILEGKLQRDSSTLFFPAH
ncbi:uncharacterized protein LOC121245092 isoform X1 [Juglans microcarpa x Juglans regia]|uniref:uncharacterized protein LOC121245092 isoform X1 n=1 Tax=Juglans microcarpa x Juglans regia TaxID=2249226 RepID=UPI001B7DCAA7|nr:uncharacterized protein LOC121245092 isoform X1 [Juglans microcarpa x Juglans regia]